MKRCETNDSEPGSPQDGLQAPDLEAQLNIAARLSALECFASHLLEAALPATAANPLAIDGIHRRMLDTRLAEVVSEAYSELASSELNYAIRRLISLQREMLGLPRGLRR